MTWLRLPPTPSPHRDRQRSRAGISAIEITVAILLLASVFAMLGPMLSWIRQQRRCAEDRQLALLELANAAERVSLLNYEALTAEQLAQLTLPAVADAELRDARLTATVDEESAPVARRVTLQLSWKEDGVRESAPLRLVLWRFPGGESTP
ncbi:MAG: hypothetical protein ACK5Q5_06015 [Planctomycetaceae bacterium]